MQVQALITALDEEIARLRQARELIGGASEVKRRGRPKGSTNKSGTKVSTSAGKVKAVRASAATSGSKPKRQMSEEGKARIAAAQKARWAAQKQGSATPKKTRGAAAKAKPAGTLDRRTRAGKAAAAAAAAAKSSTSTKKSAGASKRKPGGKSAPAMPPPSGSPEVSAQA